MAFIFEPSHDPRGESMAEEFFKAGDKVKYRGMSMPATIVSGPHKSPGVQRFLITKADGNVSLVPKRDLERIVPRLDQMAGTLAMHTFGLPFASLNIRDQVKLASLARTVLNIADRTRGEA
ncbi:hypothetical protein ACQEV9_15535 [Streptomyces chartreusis]|uniref:hypothetical protein n=1 Tax=Streptomyces chartreusis TaxID=1969 RepID=UPI003D9371A4